MLTKIIFIKIVTVL